MANPSHSQFRPEIEGLRALAALLVGIFHVWLHEVSGGVDIFFVVSGFLICTTLLGQHERTGVIRLRRFWANLLRRLLPAALVVVAFTVTVTWLFLPAVLWPDTIKHAMASVLYYENWRLVRDSADYLSQGLTSSPFQHYWALSVQMQFYILWSSLIALVMALARGRAGGRSWLGYTILSVSIVSFLFSIHLTADNQPVAYYHTGARLWQFGVGAFLALWLVRFAVSRTAGLLAGVTGLTMVLGSAFLLDISHLFPGYVAALPTLGGALILVAGNAPGIGVQRLLASRPMVWLGGLSYGFYLWHWPLLIFFWHWQGDHNVGVLAGLAIIAVALGLAWLTHWWVEKPLFRWSPGALRPGRAFAHAFVWFLPVAVLIAVWDHHATEMRRASVDSIALDDPDYPGARAMEPGFVYRGGEEVALFPGPFRVRADNPEPYDNGCHVEADDPELHGCIYGDADGERVVYIVGGSHSVQWLPAFRVFAREEGIRVVNHTKSSCLFSSPVAYNTRHGYTRESCNRWNESLMDEILREKPDLVFSTYTRGRGSEEHVPEGYMEWYRRLEAAGIPVLALRDNPWMPINPQECVGLNGPDSPECAVARERVLAAEDPAEGIREAFKNVHFADWSDYFCTAEKCPVVAGNVMIYRDRHHLTTSYVRTMAPVVRERVLAILGE